MKAELEPFDGGPSIELAKNVTVAGRGGDCDVQIDRRSVSKMHCILVKTEGFLFVRDLISTNGTKVNGQRILRAALLPGDTLSFGGTKFRVHLGPDDPLSPSQRRAESLTQRSEAMAHRVAKPDTDEVPCSTSSSVLPLPDDSDWPLPPLADRETLR